jgi:glycine dehydrogenase subunit 2
LAELCPVASGAALGVRSALTQYLPGPLVGKERSGYVLDDELPGTVGPVALTPGRLADALPLYVLFRTLGEAGLRQGTE